MADTSPGKVQALCSFFAEKEVPVMGLMQQSGKSTEASKTWKKISTTSVEDQPEEKLFSSISSAPEPSLLSTFVKHKVLPTAVQRTSLRNNFTASANSSKPEVGPKPVLQLKSPVTSLVSRKDILQEITMPNKEHSENRLNLLKSESHFARNNSELFTCGTNENFLEKNAGRNSTLPSQKIEVLECSELQSTNSSPSCTLRHSSYSNFSAEGLSKSNSGGNVSSLVSSETCVFNKFKRKTLPSKDKLGPPPQKPSRPPLVQIPVELTSNFAAPPLPEKPMKFSLSSLTSESVLPKPTKLVPLPPSSPLPSVNPSSLPFSQVLEEHSLDDELYEDTLVKEHTRPVSLIPEYTAEEELGAEEDELYDDTVIQAIQSVRPEKPKNPPPPPPQTGSTYVIKHTSCSEVQELYQDAVTDETEEFYETMPSESQLDDENMPVYGNSKKEQERMLKEEKKLRKELKEREKKEREIEKINKRFGLTGEEVPIDTWTVKSDCRGGRYDLQVKKGEIVHILRMENNPSGKWLVKNDIGKIGYVELSNIEVDADSVKSASSQSDGTTVLPSTAERPQSWLAKFTACVR